MRKLAKQGFVVVALGGVMGFGIAAVRAQDEAQGVIKYRQNVMKSHAAHFGAIGGIVKGQVPYRDHVAVHAAAINGTSKMIPQIFPEGSGTGETRAKPEIWQQWSKFEQAAKKLQKETAKLVQIAESGDIEQIAPQFIAVGEACSGCHKAFRKRR
jgi:cytochrome c556